ncbi:MAG: hypothetical protein IJP62_03790 [Treponema sp.]|nr:hypothetical protein [Treponema sp.]
MKTRKRAVFIMAMTALVLICTCFAGCENESVTDVTPDTPDSTPKQPTEAPTAPQITSGWYTLKKTPNVLVTIDTANSRILIETYASYEAYLRVENKQEQTGDVVSTSFGELVWVQTPLLNYISAYKVQINGKEFYIYGSGSSPSIAEIDNSEQGKISVIENEGLVNISDIRKSRKYPDEGVYISAKNATVAAKITVNSEEKYLYAVVAESGKKITFYLNESDAVADFSTLTAYDTLTNLTYDFYSTYLEAKQNNWIVDSIDQSTTLLTFRVKKDGAMSFYVRLIKKN